MAPPSSFYAPPLVGSPNDGDGSATV